MTTMLAGFALAQDWRSWEAPDVVLAFLAQTDPLELVPAGLEVTGAREVDSSGYIDMERCLAHGFSTPGQDFHVSGSDFHVSGSVGGKVLGRPFDVTSGSGTVSVTSLAVSSLLDENMRRDAAWSLRQILDRFLVSDTWWDVALIVADDFADGHYVVPEEVFAFASRERDGAALAAYTDSGKFSHGSLVLHHVNAMIANTNHFRLGRHEPESGTFEWLSDYGRLTVKGLDLSTGVLDDPITSPEIANRIGSEIQALNSDVANAFGRKSNFVVNMSWVMLPCPTVRAFLENKDQIGTWEEYLAALEVPGSLTGLATGTEYFTELTRLLSWVPASDPLFQMINAAEGIGTGEDLTISFVASAGNFGMKFQMLPAAWPGVVGVGSPDPLENSGKIPLPPFSNYYADVVAPGAWFWLTPDVPGEPVSVSGELSYAGTSYSAPLVSLVLALEMGTGSYCTEAWLPTEPPRLAKVPRAEDLWLGDALFLGPPDFCERRPDPEEE